MISLGRQAGREVVCLLTDMDQPLGAAVGNALEVREALDTVRGHGPPDFTELVLDACGKLLALSDLGIDEAEGRRRAEAAVADGSAEAVWRRWIEAQGGTSDESALPVAPVIRAVAAPAAGVRLASSARSASGTRPCTSARAGRPRTTSSITRSASSAARSGERTSRRATCWRRCTRAPRPGPTRLSAACSPRTSSRTKPPPERPVLLDVVELDTHRYGGRVPELPEVETVRRRLAPVLEGRVFDEVEIGDARLTRPFDPVEIARELEGERVAAVDRRGKYLIVRFESGRSLLVHLRMTGSLLHGARRDSCRTIPTAVLLSG